MPRLRFALRMPAKVALSNHATPEYTNRRGAYEP